MNEVHKLLPPKDKTKKKTQLNKNKKHTEPTTHNNMAIGKGFTPLSPFLYPPPLTPYWVS
jgi:hypothetical protein